MDIDFLIIASFYLAIILAIHFYFLKNKNIKASINKKNTNNTELKLKQPDSEDTNSDLVSIKSEINNSEDAKSDKNELILDLNELDNNMVNSELLKYLNIEQNDTKNIYQDLSNKNDILDKNNDSLNSYFTENNEKYTFDAVPTLSENKNSQNIIDSNNMIMAFDEFNENTYASIQ